MTWVPGRPRNRPTGRTSVYRLFDASGALLYIGCSYNPTSRWRTHRQLKAWWHEVATTDVVWFETLVEAERAEQEAILTEHPKYNIVHTPLHAKICDSTKSLSEEDVTRWAYSSWPSSLGTPVNGIGLRSKLHGQDELLGQARNHVQQISEGRTGGKGRPAESDKPEA